MIALQNKIRELQRMARPEYLQIKWEEAVNDINQFIVDLLIQQHEASIDGDGASLGTYAYTTKVEKMKKGTWRGWDIKLVDDAKPFGKHWRDAILIRIEDNAIYFIEEYAYGDRGDLLTPYLTGKTGWHKGRPEAMMLTQDNKDIVVREVKRLMLERI